MPQNLKDAHLSKTGALPGASTSAAIGTIDLGHSGETSDFVARCELLVEAPALTTGELPNAATLKVKVEHGNEADMSDAADLVTGVPLALGAGGAGAPASQARIGLPSNVKRYIRVSIVNSGAGNPSAKTGTAAIVF